MGKFGQLKMPEKSGGVVKEVYEELFIMRMGTNGLKHKVNDVVTWQGRMIICNEAQAAFLEAGVDLNGLQTMYRARPPEKEYCIMDVAEFDKKYVRFEQWVMESGMNEQIMAAFQPKEKVMQ